ncbi:F-box domain-containing protein [Favolaschia claudopus]|uniref:F-box domain-containing protein n=1 Tax=Favolaschia claudopus TaxID=2862362 RepID=A0AAW0DGV6_9AGAR
MHYHPLQRYQPPPINALPVELLSYIFVLGTHEPINSDPNADDDCQPFNTDSVKAPLVYASVSRHWRGVALNTPALYTSLCITPELLREVGKTEMLDISGISTYLKRSRNLLVDILIDARDQQWDFEDDGAWFSAEHMTAAMDVLLPHIRRWRSLSILTDVLAPMQAALEPLETHLRLSGAPHLESLRLMRCDAYAAHAPLANIGNSFLSSVTNGDCLLPRLQRLTLRGVPAAWTVLATTLSPALKSLELAFLPLAGQPTILELVALLRTVPHLSRFILNGSGPAFPDSAALSSSPPSFESISLPSLGSLTLGYTSSAAAVALFDLISAPSLHQLILEDATHPTDTIPVDALPLLNRLFSSNAEPAFPNLADLALRRTHLSGAPPSAHLSRLELLGTNPLALALRATDMLCIRGPLATSSLSAAPTEALAQTGFALRAVVEECGDKAPRVICLHESSYASHVGEPDEVFLLGGGTTCVRVFRRAEEEGDEDETMMGSEIEYEEEAFKVGGVFNDPVFDARYGYVG